MSKKRRALALFSGGLDSAIAIKLIKDQGVEVIPLNFVSHFFGGKNEKAEKMAEQLGVNIEYVHFEKRHTEIVKNPVYGRGKNMNPCIDCHSLMFRVAGELLEKYDADFVISGEVLGQRPMSQNMQALEKVKKLSGMDELIVRPLCAKLLPPSKPELEGWIDREKLLDIQGRSRHKQMELMEKYGIVEYPSPGGGCLLTDPAFSDRMTIIEKDGYLDEEHSHLFHLAKKSRFYRLDTGKYLFVGRDEESNKKIAEYRDKGSFYLCGHKVSGPHMLGFGNFSKEDMEAVKNLFSRYSKAKGKEVVEVRINDEISRVDVVDVAQVEEFMKKYQIVG